MEKAFLAEVGALDIELGGNVVLSDGENVLDFLCGFFEPWKNKNASVEKIENYAVLTGHQDGIVVGVYEYLHKDKAMKELTPFYNRDGVKKFAAENDVYVVLTKDSDRRIYVIAHRSFPTRKMVWEAGQCRYLPPELGRRNEKPLTQRMDLVKTEPDNGDKELDEKTKNLIAESQLAHGNGKNDKRPKRRTEAQVS